MALRVNLIDAIEHDLRYYYRYNTLINLALSLNTRFLILCYFQTKPNRYLPLPISTSTYDRVAIFDRFFVYNNNFQGNNTQQNYND